MVDSVTVDAICDDMRLTAEWAEMVKDYADVTNWGYIPLDPFFEMYFLWVIQEYVGAQYEFGEGTDIGQMFNDAALTARFVDQIELDVWDAAPTDVHGMLLGPAKLKNAKGEEVEVAKDKVVKLTGRDGTDLEVLGYAANVRLTGTIDKKLFRRQPGLTLHDHDHKSSTAELPQEYGYKDFSPKDGQELTPDGKDPKVSDVSQGSIGDCYLMAGMGAVVAMRPDLIKQMVHYDSSSNTYTVIFKDIKSDGTVEDVPIMVDAYLPTSNKSNPIYAQDAARAGGDNQAIWPAIVEKAYAVWKGDYEEIVGGRSGAAMEVVTGVKSSYPSMPAEDKVIAMFETWQKEGKAVCCGSVDWIEKKSVGGFAGAGDGPYTAKLPGSGTKAATLVEKSLRVKGAVGGTARDVGDGAMSGPGLKEGKVTYKGADVSLTWDKDKGPKKTEDLVADYRFKRLVSEALNIYGNHAYMFVKVDGGKLHFANPWGPTESYQPKALEAKDFVKYFESIAVNAPPKVADGA